MAYSPLHDTAPPSYNEVVRPKVRYCHTPGVGDGRDSRTTAPTLPLSRVNIRVVVRFVNRSTDGGGE